jgi:hypothetical protein
MGLVNTVIGAIALAVGCGAIWGIIFVIELSVKSMGVDVFQYVLAAPLVLIISYFLGDGIQANRKSHSKSR